MADPFPTRPGELSDSEQLMVEWIRAGMVDAEIAVRLGVSGADVRERTRRLAAKLGVEGRDGLRTAELPSTPKPGGTDSKQRSERTVRGVLAAMIAAISIAFLGGLVVGSRDGEQSQAAASTTAALSSATPAATGTPAPTMALVNGRSMAYAGRLISVPYWGFRQLEVVSSREDLLAVRLAAPGYVLFETGVMRWSQTQNASTLAGVVAGQPFKLLLSPGDDGTRLLPGSSDSIPVYTTDERANPLLLLSVEGPDRTHHHVELTPEGDLYIELQPIPAETPIETWTGEALDVTDAVAVGRLDVSASNWLLTTCADLVCWVSYSPPSAPARNPFPGSEACLVELPAPAFITDRGYSAPSAALTVTFGGAHVHVWPVSYPGVFDDFTCAGGSGAAAGEPLLFPGQYVITATSKDGSPLDVVAGLDGTLYVGEVVPRVGCPCRAGS